MKLNAEKNISLAESEIISRKKNTQCWQYQCCFPLLNRSLSQFQNSFPLRGEAAAVTQSRSAHLSPAPRGRGRARQGMKKALKPKPSSTARREIANNVLLRATSA